MADVGIEYVRIGEFMWSVIEPSPGGTFEWGLLDKAIETLASHNLKIVLGTPTACPPKWLVDKHPDILPYGDDGRPRKFGSRRHNAIPSSPFRSLISQALDPISTLDDCTTYLAKSQVHHGSSSFPSEPG
jgi:beta-galactosidase